VKTCRFLLCLLAIGLLMGSCRKRAQSESGTDDGKLRPEVAAATKNASPTPGLGELSTKASPSSSADSSPR
jgi:hypothetical protein